MTGLAVDDPVVGPVTCPETTIEPGETVTCTSTYTVTAADAARGFIANTAVAAGTENGNTITSPPSRQTLLIGWPRITLRKRVVSAGPYSPGSIVRYKYLVTNTGPRTLFHVTVTDDRVAPVVCARTVLAPGQSTVCGGWFRVTAADARLGRVTNLAQAVGIDICCDKFSSDIATVTVPVAKGWQATG